MDATIHFKDGHTSKIEDVESITERVKDIMLTKMVFDEFQIKHKVFLFDLDNVKQIKISW